MKEGKDKFAWCPGDMVCIPQDIDEHSLSVYLDYKPVVQKKRSLAAERGRVLDTKVKKQVEAGIIREV